MSLAALLAWVRRQPVPAPRPALPLTDLPPELRQLIERNLAVRPLLRLGQASRRLRDDVDWVFVYLFVRDIHAHLAWPTPTKADAALKTMAKDLVLANVTGAWDTEGMEQRIPFFLARLYFMPMPQPLSFSDGHEAARAQKLYLADIYRRTCLHLAWSFVRELRFVALEMEETDRSQTILFYDLAVPENNFWARFERAAGWFSDGSRRLSFAFAVSCPAEVRRYVQALNMLAPTINTANLSDEVRTAWVNAFMNLLLGISPRYASVTFLSETMGRHVGLRTLTRPIIMENDQ